MSATMNATEFAAAGDYTAAAHLIIAAALTAVTAPDDTKEQDPCQNSQAIPAREAASPATATPPSSSARN